MEINIDKLGINKLDIDEIDIDGKVEEYGVGMTILGLISARDEIDDRIRECDKKRRSLDEAWRTLHLSINGVFNYIEKNDPERYNKLKIESCPRYELKIMHEGRLFVIEQNKGYQEKILSRISISSGKVEIV